MNVKHIMTWPVFSIGPDATVLQAVQLMLRHKISGLPVVDADGKLLGIVTEGDFLRRAEIDDGAASAELAQFLVGPGRLADEYVHTHTRKIADVMTPEPYAITEDTSLEEVVQLMEKHRIKRLPVVRDKQLVGIVSRANLLHALASLAPTVPETVASDETIRSNLLAELERQKWAPVGLLNVIVRNGIVDLWGTIPDERERQAPHRGGSEHSRREKRTGSLVWVDPKSGVVIGAKGEVVAA